MTKPSPEIEPLAAQRLAADEDRITGQAKRRQSLTLRRRVAPSSGSTRARG